MNARILWGTNYENQLLVGRPLYNLVTDRVARAGSQWAQSPGGLEDAWIVGRDYTLWCTARWVPDGNGDATMTALSGPIGWQAFFDWARDKNAFRFVPDESYPDAYVDACYLVEPLEKGPLGTLDDVILRDIPFQIRNATVDFHQALRGVLFEYAPGGSLTDPVTATFTRADSTTCATYVDSKGFIRTVAANVLRDRHYVGVVRTALLEPASTNLVVQSDAITAANGWTVTTATATGAYATHASRPFTRIVGAPAGSATVNRAVTLTGNGVKAFSVLVHGDGVDGTFTVGLYDSSATAYRVRVTVTVSAGVVTAVAITGTVLRVVALAESVYRIECASTACTAANAHLALAVDGATQTIASVQVSGVQVENLLAPSSLIPTGAATVTRAADRLTFPYLYVPQSLTVYAKFVELGACALGKGVLALGDSVTPTDFLYATGGVYQWRHYMALAQPTATAAATPAIGDTVELRGVVNADGNVTLGQSINGAAEATSAGGGPAAFDTAYGTLLVTLGSRAVGEEGMNPLAVLKIASGIRTLAQMRAL